MAKCSTGGKFGGSVRGMGAKKSAGFGAKLKPAGKVSLASPRGK